MTEEELIRGAFTLGGAVLGAIMTFLFARANLEKRHLKVYAVGGIDAMSVRDDVTDKLSIKYDGHDVERISTYVFDIANTGNKDLSALAVPINLHGTSKYLGYRCLRGEQIQATVSTSAGSAAVNGVLGIQVSLPLLKPKETVRLQVILDGIPERSEAVLRQENLKVTFRQLSGSNLSSLIDAVAANVSTRASPNEALLQLLIQLAARSIR